MTRDERYARQMLLPEIDGRGQEKLDHATVAIVGLGGLGSPVAFYLAAAGVGRLILIDQDTVEITNLNRQIIHWEEDVAKHRPKVESAAEKVHEFNGRTEIIQHNSSLDEHNVALLLDEADVIADCVDNFHARRAMNQFCVRNGKPLVHAAVEEWSGHVTTIVPGSTPCLNCLFER
ncbi:MAG TPA: HesA/MoeB/ThiF family protein, partial [Methanomassiliicoccales archaeon]|nr:HesA/MoeB/ThiF family protein [Methanomassiliicoccales archaeon]